VRSVTLNTPGNHAIGTENCCPGLDVDLLSSLDGPKRIAVCIHRTVITGWLVQVDGEAYHLGYQSRQQHTPKHTKEVEMMPHLQPDEN